MATEDFDIYFQRAATLYTADINLQKGCIRSPVDTVRSLSQSQHHQHLWRSVEPCPVSASAGNRLPSENSSLRHPRRSVSCKYPTGTRNNLAQKPYRQRETVDERSPTRCVADGSVNGVPRHPSGAGPPSAAETATSIVLLSDNEHAFDGTGQSSIASRLTSGLTGGGSGVTPRTTNSAPHSRSSSWRKARRPNDSLPHQLSKNAGGAGLSLESAVIEKLQQLKLMQEDDYCVVRSFRTKPSRGIVSRGNDRFRRLHATSVDDPMINGSHLQSASLNRHRASSFTASSSSTNGQQQQQQQVTEVAVTTRNGQQTPATEIKKVLVVGMANVGKTALLQQFMTSQYMAAVCTSFDDEFDKTVTVVLDDDEMLTLDFVDVGALTMPLTSSAEVKCPHQEKEKDKAEPAGVADGALNWRHAERNTADAYLVVFSMTDPLSFQYAVQATCELRRRRASARLPVSNTMTYNCTASSNEGTTISGNSKSCIRPSGSTADCGNPVIIMVANKSDLVRTRQVSKADAKCACSLMNCKYIEVSASLNHRVDDLLVGIVRQIRKRNQLATVLPSHGGGLQRKRSAKGLTSTACNCSDVRDRCPSANDEPCHDSSCSMSTETEDHLSKVASCPDSASSVLCSLKAAKELFKEVLFHGSDATPCLEVASDTDCENLLDL